MPKSELKVKLLTHTMNPELVIACAGKLCYSPVGVEQLLEKQTDQDIERFVKMLVSMGHESPLEHASFTFAIEGVSRSLTHQLVRHRIASYSQQSQRYVREKEFDYVVPKDIENCFMAELAYRQFMIICQNTYDYIVDNLIFSYLKVDNKVIDRICKNNKYNKGDLMDLVFNCFENCDENQTLEQIMDNKRLILSKISEKYPKVINGLIKRAIENARYVLPNGCETKIVVTMNLRTLINFCHHRICRRAQEEIRDLALAMVEEVKEISPLLAKSLGAPCQFGSCPEGSMSCGKPMERLV